MSTTFDVLIIGEGLAGSIAALRAADLGAKVCLVSHKTAASSWAQGGIVYQGENDPELLFQDVLQSGAQINNKAAVEKVLEKGPLYIEEWLQKRLQISFDSREDGALDLGLEAAHSTRRILHIKDKTGRGILEPLQKAVQDHPSIERVKGTVVELVLSDRHGLSKHCEYQAREVAGAYFLTGENKVQKILARSTILASGGYSGIFWHSSGPSSNIGAGISVAHRAGAKTLHLEFVQFHPTTLYKEHQPRTLLTEALRGEGAFLLDEKGERFVDELAPRDQVARAIHQKIASSNGPCVFLDLRHLGHVEEKFPGVVALLEKNKINYQKELVPVVPSSHYTIGGVWTDLDGKSSLPGLWACGEVACTGLHGANRLASMSLLEALVFGVESATDATKVALIKKDLPMVEYKDWVSENEEVDPILLQQDWSLLKQSMWNYVGLIRTQKRLQRAENLINELRTEVESFYKKSCLTESLVNLRHAVLVASLTLYSALRRNKSLGTHYLEESLH